MRDILLTKINKLPRKQTPLLEDPIKNLYYMQSPGHLTISTIVQLIFLNFFAKTRLGN